MSKGKTNGRMEAVEANNIKAMREALCDIVMLTMKVGYSIRGDVACGIIASKAKHALKQPPRNCDLYADEQSAWEAFSDARQGVDSSTEEYEKWLFEKAEVKHE